VYADGGDAWLDENAPVAGGGVTTTALTAERNARELFDGDTVVLRFGLFMGPDSGSTLAALAAAVGVEALRQRAPQDGPLARSQRVSSRRLREASGWAPRMRAGTEFWGPAHRIAA
jgi:hypothetical protein